MDAERIDGRRLRAVKTRAAIVAALYELVRAGDPAPTAARIAERAGVALRSIGQHFPSREALLAAVAEHHVKVAPHPKAEATRPLRARVTAFVRARAEDLERTAPMRRAIAVMPKPSPAVIAGVRRELDRRRTELSEAFARELADGDPHLLDRLDVVSSGPAWDVMRQLQQLSFEAASAELRTLITDVVQGGPRT